MMITAAHCSPCGACCQTSRLPLPPAWANCTPEDVQRMKRRVRLNLVPMITESGERTKATPIRADGTCGFLRGTPGESTRCAIYDSRPTICRRFEPGSEFCRASRREIGLPT